MKAFGDPAGIRTLDPVIKSHLLYQLSYGVVCGCNNTHFCVTASRLVKILTIFTG